MNTMVHLAGILAALWLSYLCFVPIGGVRVKAETVTAAAVQHNAAAICVESGRGFTETGRLRIEGDTYDYEGTYSCAHPPGSTGLELDGETTSTQYASGVTVEQILDPVLSQATYLGWAFVVVALLLLPAMLIAMRYDFVRPVGEDV